MLTNQNDRKMKIRSIDYLLILGFILAPMTEFRIWKIGPAEALVFLWSLRFVPSIFDFRIRNILRNFWILFLLTVLVGTIFGMLRYPRQSSGLTAYLTWIYMALVSMGIYYGLMKYEVPYIRRLLEVMVIAATLWYLFLYIYAHQISMEFMGARLYYRNRRYTGGAENPHQVAGLLVNCVFIMVYLILNTKRIRTKVFYLLCIGIHLFLISTTLSSTAMLAVAAGFFLTLLEWFIRKGNNRTEEKYRLLMTAIAAVFILLFAFSFLFEAFYKWVASDPNGLQRFQIFASIGDTMKKSFLFGLGPGKHSMGGAMEYHNTYLEVLAMGGIIGALIFTVFSIKLFIRLITVPQAILAPFAMYIFGLSGFGMRRLPYWFVIAFFLVISEKHVFPNTPQNLRHGDRKEKDLRRI